MASSPQDVQTADATLVQRLAAGDESALAEFYDRHGRLAYSLACAIVGDPADAEDVVADAFAQLWRTASSFDAARGGALSWLTTIVRTRALDLLRGQRRRARIVERAATLADDEGIAGLAPFADSPTRGIEQSEARLLVQRSLAELPPPQRRVIELAYYGGLSQSEIAAQLAEPLGTVKTRMRAGMEKLRQSLGPLVHGGGEP